MDVIDLYQIHWPEPDADIEEGWTEMARLKEEGKVRHIGVSNFNVAQMKRAAAIAPIRIVRSRILISMSENLACRRSRTSTFCQQKSFQLGRQNHKIVTTRQLEHCRRAAYHGVWPT